MQSPCRRCSTEACLALLLEDELRVRRGLEGDHGVAGRFEGDGLAAAPACLRKREAMSEW